jgi:PhzF family phenazine biosynthesis protein
MTEDQSKTSIPFYQVDAFSDEAFRGNPAAVCLVDEAFDDDLMQTIAAENNLSETAFLSTVGGAVFLDADEFHLRWFTPTVEVPLCGHATLATSAVLFHELGYPRDEICFRSLSGRLVARRHPDGILLDFPADTIEPFDLPEGLLHAMGLAVVEETYFAKRGRDIMLRVDDPKVVKGLKPDFQGMVAATGGLDVNGAVVTSLADRPYDFISRFFAPWLGINEDPVTGAAHTVLTPYWSQELGKKRMRAYQASNRGGKLTVEVAPEDRVYLIGEATIVIKGMLLL